LATVAEQDAFCKLHRLGTLSETLSNYIVDISWTYYHYCAILGLRRQNPYAIGLPQGMWKGNTWEDQHGTFNHPWQDSYVRRYRPNTVFDQQIS